MVNFLGWLTVVELPHEWLKHCIFASPEYNITQHYICGVPFEVTGVVDILSFLHVFLA